MVEGCIKYKCAVVDDGDVVAGDALAQQVGEEGGVAIDGVAVGSVEDGTDDGAGYFGREDDGRLLGGDAARAEAAEGAAGGFVADGDGIFQQAGGARVGVPVVALHVAGLVVGDGLGGEAAIAAAILAGEAARVHHDLVRGGRVEVASAGVLDAGVVGHGGGLDLACDFDAG